MKKILCLLAACLVTLTLQAQNRFSYSFEIVGGVGVGRGPLATLTPQFVAQYELGGGFRMGAGAGTRFALPCLQYITENGKYSRRTFCDELDLPVFLRIGYGKEKLFANVDAGYAVALLSIYGLGWKPGGRKEACYNGFFVEPHIGLKLGKRSALALGVLLQQSTVMNHMATVTGEFATPSYAIHEEVKKVELLTPAITLRYAYRF